MKNPSYCLFGFDVTDQNINKEEILMKILPIGTMQEELQKIKDEWDMNDTEAMKELFWIEMQFRGIGILEEKNIIGWRDIWGDKWGKEFYSSPISSVVQKIEDLRELLELSQEVTPVLCYGNDEE